MFVLQDPARARSLGLLGTKAQLSGGTADWPGYFALLAQMVAVGGMLLFGMVLIWLFGREFADRTAKDLLALPTSRAAVVAAKLVVALAWSLLLTAELVAVSLPLGAVLGLRGWSTQVLLHGVGASSATACLTVVLATTYALAASWGRGYLACRRNAVRHGDHRSDRLGGRLRRLVPVGRALTDVRRRRPRPGHARRGRDRQCHPGGRGRRASPPCCGGSAPTMTADARTTRRRPSGRRPGHDAVTRRRSTAGRSRPRRS